MIKIAIADLESKILNSALKAGLNNENAAILTDIYMRATFRGVGHHDIESLVERFTSVLEERINPNPLIEKISGFNALEGYDGDNGLGELCSYFITQKSIDLATRYGIGLATIRNSNHFLAAAPYNEIADEQGFFTLLLSKSTDGLSLPGAEKSIIGNNPFGYAAGYEDGKILFDICCAYSSYGKINEKIKNHKEVPEYWGNDSEGRPTRDPARIKESGLFMPIGEHKGFGLALMVELLTSIISGGSILNQDEKVTGLKGVYSQTAISINVNKILKGSEYRDRNQEMVHLLKQIFPDIYIPGERSVRVREEIEARGFFEIDETLFNRIDSLFPS